MASMDQSCVRQAMEVVQLHQRKANMGKVLELMETVQGVRQVQSQVRILLSAGEYIAPWAGFVAELRLCGKNAVHMGSCA